MSVELVGNDVGKTEVAIVDFKNNNGRPSQLKGRSRIQEARLPER